MCHHVRSRPALIVPNYTAHDGGTCIFTVDDQRTVNTSCNNLIGSPKLQGNGLVNCDYQPSIFSNAE